MNKHTRIWPLQEAKAKFSKLVRLAQTEGPQTVTVHGKIAVKVTAATEGVGDDETGASLVALLNKSPLRRMGPGLFRRASLKAKGRSIDL